MKTFDVNSNVVSWASEEVCIPYISPIDNKTHKYFPDFLIELKSKNGQIETLLIEVKPSKQTTEPQKPKSGKITRRFVTESKSYAINTAKWKAAEKACEKMGWKFKILTEKEIF